MTDPGTDKRLDDLREDTRHGFDRLDADIRELRAEGRELRSEMKAGFDRSQQQMNGLQQQITNFQGQMTIFFAGILGTVVAGVIVNAILSHS